MEKLTAISTSRMPSEVTFELVPRITGRDTSQSEVIIASNDA